MRTAPLARALWLALYALVTGCAGLGIPSEELPDRPIALLYWEPEDARRRADAIEQRTEPQGSELGVATVESLRDMLEGSNPEANKPLMTELARWPGHIALLNPRTGELTRLDAASPGSRPLAWSADGQRLLFASSRPSGQPQLYEYDFGTRELRPVTQGEESHPRGDYGPDGRVVYTSVRFDGKSIRGALYVTPAGGGGPRRLLDGPVVDSPQFAPDGRSVLYVGRPAGEGGAAPARRQPPAVFACDLESDQTQMLAPGRDPVYTRDGAWIVFSAPVKDGWRLRRMRPDGFGRTGVGPGTRDELSPAVSPDGRYVVYVSQENRFDRLFVRRIDGSGDRLLLEDGAVAWPVW